MATLLIVTTIVAITTITYLFVRHRPSITAVDTSGTDAPEVDPGLLKKHSVNKTYHAAGFVYPSIRTFYHPHPQAAKLPTKPTSLPLLVFVHGLGGSIAQFAPLLTGLVNAAPCLAIDLPGCGMSAFDPKLPDAYTSQALAQLIAAAIHGHRDVEHEQKVIFIAHSMGCSLAALLASSTSPLAYLLKGEVAGVIAICPKAEPLGARQVSRLKYVRWMPIPLFELYRTYDRRGGLESASVRRYVGADADVETKRLQLRFNEQSKSEVFLAMALGSMPLYGESGDDSEPAGGLPGKSVWSGLRVPTFLIAGQSDHICPPASVELIATWLGRHATSPDVEETVDSGLPTSAGEAPTTDSTAESNTDGANQDSTKSPEDLKAESRSVNGAPKAPTDIHLVLKTTTLPAPASHALLYATPSVRILSGLIQSFLATHIDHRLSLGWQLQHLSTEGKWDVKNLQKWQAISPVSDTIASVFRAMKTLREVDEQHTSNVFVKTWGARNGVQNGGIRMVVDISHESPVYDPKGLEQGKIEYHKFPTVSKLPPSPSEVRSFIALVDALRTQLAKEEIERGVEAGAGAGARAVIGVHCHYGFNRTGFFIVSYLVERLGYRLQDALDEFAEKRAPGIRHEHFVNELFVRYGVQLQRRPTIC